ncbi:hypothetical protein BUALT_Bualt07G0079000 [Buddleja alternifolia]|uniref:Retrotransposon Copia-like N-terminal domain-containing protein n=1 Tax=Buddleja alternifolia TaxID=168488 RepID=A0AAV6XAB3_9LAMI|nr:hypothetical protein BUALT_Bualt07G0079000 [Buddleja alternifolia]
MSEVSKKTPSSTKVAAPFEQSTNNASSELQGMHYSYRLDGRNYLQWSQLVRTFLKGRGKIAHLTGPVPQTSDPAFAAWDIEDSMLIEDATTLTTMLARDRIVKFLAGLNPEYDQIRIQILGKKKLPSLNEVFSMIRSEEHQRIATLDESNIDRSAMISAKPVDPHTRPQNLPSASIKSKHTNDTCFKLHGKEAVLNRIGGFKNLQSRNQANLASHEPNEVPEKPTTMVPELGEFSEDEISKLRSFLKTIQSSSCSLAQTDSHALNENGQSISVSGDQDQQEISDSLTKQPSIPSVVKFRGSPYVFKRRSQPTLDSQHVPNSSPNSVFLSPLAFPKPPLAASALLAPSIKFESRTQSSRLKYFDLRILNRDAIDHKVTVESAGAALEYNVATKCALITPDEARTKEFGLKSYEEKSQWQNQICVEWNSARVDQSIRAFAESSTAMAFEEKWTLYLSTKNTVLKKYDCRSKDTFQEGYNENWNQIWPKVSREFDLSTKEFMEAVAQNLDSKLHSTTFVQNLNPQFLGLTARTQSFWSRSLPCSRKLPSKLNCYSTSQNVARFHLLRKQKAVPQPKYLAYSTQKSYAKTQFSKVEEYVLLKMTWTPIQGNLLGSMGQNYS